MQLSSHSCQFVTNRVGFLFRTDSYRDNRYWNTMKGDSERHTICSVGSIYCFLQFCRGWKSSSWTDVCVFLTRWTTRWSCCRTAGVNSSSSTTSFGRWCTPRRAPSYWSLASRWVGYTPLLKTLFLFLPKRSQPCISGSSGSCNSSSTFPLKPYWSLSHTRVSASLKIDDAYR